MKQEKKCEHMSNFTVAVATFVITLIVITAIETFTGRCG
jgi:hypothetical protein